MLPESVAVKSIVCETTGMSTGMWYLKPKKIQGRPQKMNREMELDLLDFLEYKPRSYLDEMCWFLFDEFEIVLSTSTVS